VWGPDNVRRTTVVRSSGGLRGLLESAGMPTSFSEADAGNQVLLTSGVRSAAGLAGRHSVLGRTGVFTSLSQLTAWLRDGAGVTLGQGLVLSEGLVMSESGQIDAASTTREVSPRGE